MRTVDYEMQ